MSRLIAQNPDEEKRGQSRQSGIQCIFRSFPTKFSCDNNDRYVNFFTIIDSKNINLQFRMNILKFAIKRKVLVRILSQKEIC